MNHLNKKKATFLIIGAVVLVLGAFAAVGIILTQDNLNLDFRSHAGQVCRRNPGDACSPSARADTRSSCCAGLVCQVAPGSSVGKCASVKSYRCQDKSGKWYTSNVPCNVVTPSATSAMYRCQDRNGNWYMSNVPCTTTTPSSTPTSYRCQDRNGNWYISKVPCNVATPTATPSIKPTSTAITYRCQDRSGNWYISYVPCNATTPTVNPTTVSYKCLDPNTGVWYLSKVPCSNIKPTVY